MRKSVPNGSNRSGVETVTLEKRYFIEFSDITSVELECSNCQAKLLFQSFDLEKLAVQCPNCQKVFFNPQRGDLQMLAELGNKLAEVRKRNLKGIRLQIAVE